jgi:hypothetical protein
MRSLYKKKKYDPSQCFVAEITGRISIKFRIEGLQWNFVYGT